MAEPSALAQTAINAANMDFIRRVTPHPQAVSPLQWLIMEDQQAKEDPVNDEIEGLDAVGGIMVLCMTHLYRPVLTFRTYHCHYKSGVPPLTCFFDQNPGNSFSTCPPNYGVIIS